MTEPLTDQETADLAAAIRGLGVYRISKHLHVLDRTLLSVVVGNARAATRTKVARALRERPLSQLSGLEARAYTPGLTA